MSPKAAAQLAGLIVSTATRGYLLAQLEGAIAGGKKARVDQMYGQESLFGDSKDERHEKGEQEIHRRIQDLLASPEVKERIANIEYQEWLAKARKPQVPALQTCAQCGRIQEVSGHCTRCRSTRFTSHNDRLTSYATEEEDRAWFKDLLKRVR